jgi:hypothetical protein
MKTITRWVVLCALFAGTHVTAQQSHIGEGLADVATVVAETKTVDAPQDSAATKESATVVIPAKPRPAWKDKLYYGYNFDIYYHHDTRSDRKVNGWSISVTPEIGWRLKERLHLGMRFGGGYQSLYLGYATEDSNGKETTSYLRVNQGAWEVTPYARYRLKTLFNDKVGIWLEAHVYTGMEFPRVVEGETKGTDYNGLAHNVIYGLQVSPVITYQFNRKSTFQIFFSIISFGYSGTAFFYQDPDKGVRHTDYTNDIIVFSGKLSNLLANQFTPGLYGLKFGVQKSF